MISRPTLLRGLLTVLVSTFSCLGQVDESFNAVPAVPLSSNYNSGLTTQPDGKVFVWGNFDSVNDKARAHVARLDADGGVDPSFNCASCDFSGVTSVAVQQDGAILVAGSYNPIYRQLFSEAR